MQGQVLKLVFFTVLRLHRYLRCMGSACVPANISSGCGYCIDTAPVHVLVPVNIQAS